MKEHLIWGNTHDCLDFDDWKDDLQAEYPDYNDEELYELMLEINNDYLNDERMNMNKYVGSPIVVFAKLKTWRGVFDGYKIIESGNLKDCLYDEDCDHRKWYCEDGEFRFDGWHHDSDMTPNRYTYRKLKKDVSVYEFEEMTPDERWEATESLFDDVKNIYGFADKEE